GVIGDADLVAIGQYVPIILVDDEEIFDRHGLGPSAAGTNAAAFSTPGIEFATNRVRRKADIVHLVPKPPRSAYHGVIARLPQGGVHAFRTSDPGGRRARERPGASLREPAQRYQR